MRTQPPFLAPSVIRKQLLSPLDLARRLPSRLVRTTPLGLARPAQALDQGTPSASSPVPNPSSNIMPRSHSLPSRVPPAWHATPVILLDFSQYEHDDLHVAEGQAPGEPQCRSLLLNPDTRTAPLLQHNLDLGLNDSDARFIASRHATSDKTQETKRIISFF